MAVIFDESRGLLFRFSVYVNVREGVAYRFGEAKGVQIDERKAVEIEGALRVRTWRVRPSPVLQFKISPGGLFCDLVNRAFVLQNGEERVHVRQAAGTGGHVRVTLLLQTQAVDRSGSDHKSVIGFCGSNQ